MMGERALACMYYYALVAGGKMGVGGWLPDFMGVEGCPCTF